MTDAQRKPPLVIGLTGPIGSGASTVARFLEAKGFRCVTLSTPIKEAFRKRHNLPTGADVKGVLGWRRELQDIGDEGRDEHRGGRLTRWVEEALVGVPQGADLVIDGFRNMAEVQYLRDFFTKSFLIAVTADRAVRWERTKPDYDHKEDEFDRADKRDSEDKDDLPYGQQVERCVNAADYVLANNDKLEPMALVSAFLEKELATPIELMRGRKRENPKQNEAHMAEAYALAHRSLCLKRHVGAVIVDANGLPVSSGFNENPPVNMKPCLIEFNNTCFKDNIMHANLEKMRGVFCPRCGVRADGLKKPWKCSNCGEDLKRRFFPSRNMEYCTALHAEERAVRGLNGRSAAGATMYVTTFPCLQCARYILDVGVKKVIYVEAYPVKESLEYLTRHGVVVEPFSGFTARAFHIIFRQVD